MLQSNYNLLEGATELAKIDYAKVPRGVCLNRPPAVRVLGVTTSSARPGTLRAVMGDSFNLFGSAHDEGLPRGKGLTVGWKMVSGPGTAAFSNQAAARTKVDFSAPGTYLLELTASDSEFTSQTRVNVIVSPSP